MILTSFFDLVAICLHLIYLWQISDEDNGDDDVDDDDDLDNVLRIMNALRSVIPSL